MAKHDLIRGPVGNSLPENAKMIDELCEIEEGLNEWELNFVDSMSKEPRSPIDNALWLTQKQTDAMVRVYEKHVLGIIHEHPLRR